MCLVEKEKHTVVGQVLVFRLLRSSFSSLIPWVNCRPWRAGERRAGMAPASISWVEFQALPRRQSPKDEWLRQAGHDSVDSRAEDILLQSMRSRAYWCGMLKPCRVSSWVRALGSGPFSSQWRNSYRKGRCHTQGIVCSVIRRAGKDFWEPQRTQAVFCLR